MTIQIVLSNEEAHQLNSLVEETIGSLDLHIQEVHKTTPDTMEKAEELSKRNTQLNLCISIKAKLDLACLEAASGEEVY